MQLYAIVAVLQAVLVVSAVVVDDARGFVLLYACYHVVSSFAGTAVAALQVVTPNEYRGQVAAAFVMTFNLFGLGLGPSAVAALTSFVFKDPRMVGWSIATVCAVVMPLSALCFTLARKPMREAVRESEHGGIYTGA
jgi:MFS family permease